MTEHFLPLSAELQQLITSEQAWHYRIVPKAVSDDMLEFFADNAHFNASHKVELEMLLGRVIKTDFIQAEQITITLGKYYRRGKQEHKARKVWTSTNQDEFLPALIAEARQMNSSDIHLECYEDKCRIRLRIDGRLIERFVIPRTDFPGLINRVKIKAQLDISEKRLPQDGRIVFTDDSDRFDIRVSVLPTLYGEKIVLRLLGYNANNFRLEDLGFNKDELDRFMNGIRRPHGLVLISGPTGSGKTTTLYAALNLLNKEQTNILTVEDPVEYTLEGINQVQLKESIGLTFAQALRTFLRQDPDIIMLGEIRDVETAQMAIRAALTGHLVLSTVHTNSAWGTASRLIDMGIPAYLLAGTLNTTLAQRLIRILCVHCKQKVALEQNQIPNNFKIPSQVSYQNISKGCEECHFTGYHGRRAIYEVIGIDEELADCIRQKSDKVNDQYKKKGIRTLADNAWQLFADGLTSFDEVYPLLLGEL